MNRTELLRELDHLARPLVNNKEADILLDELEESAWQEGFEEGEASCPDEDW